MKMESQNICGFCHKSYANKHTLERHIKTAKTCIKNREIKVKIKTYDCRYCKKSFTQKGHRTRHLETCKVKKGADIRQKTEDKFKIVALENELKGFKEGVKNGKIKNITNNGNINNYRLTTNLQYVPVENIIPLTLERVESCLPQFTYDQFREGIDGVINFIITVVSGNGDPAALSYYCTEVPRKTFYRYIVEGWIKDPKGMFINTILDTMKLQVKDHYNQFTEELIADYKRMGRETPYKTGRTMLDIEKESLYPIFTGICNFSVIERTKLLNKIREILIDKLRIDEEFVVGQKEIEDGEIETFD